jgi:hypothetical protein
MREYFWFASPAAMESATQHYPDEQLKKLVGEFPPRPAEQTSFNYEEVVFIPNLIDNHYFSPIWPE